MLTIFLILMFISVMALVFFGLSFFMPAFKERYQKSQDKREVRITRQMEESFIFWEKRKIAMIYLFPFIFGGIGLLLARNIAGIIVGFLVGYAFPNVMVVMARTRRIKKMRSQLVDSLMILSSSLKAGLSFLQAMEVLCEEMPPPVSQEFNLILSENKLGVSLEDSLRKLRRRIPIEEINLIVTSILIARESGGELPRILSRLADTIRDNLKLKEKIATLTLQGRMQGYIMMVLPVGFAWFVYKNNPGHFDVMLQTHQGRMLLLVAVILQIAGIIMIQKISTIKF